MRPGPAALEELHRQVWGCLSPGDELVAAGMAGLSGTLTLLEEKQEELSLRFSRRFLRQCGRLSDLLIQDPEAFPLDQVTCRCLPGEGGILSALWKMGEASDVGFQADLRRIPIRQETVEICEVFELNPYRLYSEGTLLLAGKNGGALVEELLQRKISARVIGRAEKGQARILWSGDNSRFLERPCPDELWKILDGGKMLHECGAS